MAHTENATFADGAQEASMLFVESLKAKKLHILDGPNKLLAIVGLRLVLEEIPPQKSSEGQVQPKKEL